MRTAFAITAGLVLSSLALSARCPKDCRMLLRTEAKACRAACANHKPAKACRSSCSSEFKAGKATCSAATNPTPPDCGNPTMTSSSTMLSTTSNTTTTTSTTPTTIAGVCGDGVINQPSEVCDGAALGACNEGSPEV